MPHLDEGLLHALVDGEVPSNELEPIQKHLLECADCRVQLEAARQMAGESNSLIELIEVPSGTQSVPPITRRLGRRGVRRWIRPVALAASLVLAVALGYAGGSKRPDSLAMREAFTPPETVLVAAAPPTAPTVASEPKLDAAQSTKDERRDRPTESDASAIVGRSGDENRSRRNPPPAAPAQGALARRDSTPSFAKPGERELGKEPMRLEEMAVTSTTERKAALADRSRVGADSLQKNLSANAPAKAPAPLPQAARMDELVVTQSRAAPISFVEAASLLGGEIRLIRGLVPLRLETDGAGVRVIYPLAIGELILRQQRSGDSLVVTLSGPLSPDSLAKLRALIR